jgi:hypothetical protein
VSDNMMFGSRGDQCIKEEPEPRFKTIPVAQFYLTNNVFGHYGKGDVHIEDVCNGKLFAVFARNKRQSVGVTIDEAVWIFEDRYPSETTKLGR